MQKILCCILLCALLAACNSGGKQAGKVSDKSIGIKGTWYKRYTGTVAGQPVVANLVCYAGTATDTLIPVSGVYYYRGKSEPIALSCILAKSTGQSLILTESPVTTRDDEGDNEAMQPEWHVSITDNGITGKWRSADGKKSYDIDLKENYDNGYPFDIVTASDSSSFKGKSWVSSITADYMLLKPGSQVQKEDAAFITKALLRDLGGDSLNAGTFEDYMHAETKEYFAGYKSAMSDFITEPDSTLSESKDWYNSLNVSCDYNDNGLVVFDITTSDYSGGAHGNNWTTTLCLDVRNKKVLHLSDVIRVDTPKLNALLEGEVRKEYKMKPSDPLSGSILVDTIPPTENFVINDKGLLFCYSPYEIACYADGDVCLFIPYAKISDLLNPEFKKRMNL